VEQMDIPNAQGFGMQKDEKINFLYQCLIVLIPKGREKLCKGNKLRARALDRLLSNGPLIYML
jgi:hypothetical protein